MPTTCRDICTRTGRKLGLLRSGGELKAADAADMLASLQSWYMESVTGGAFGRVTDISISIAGDVTAGGGQHINILTEGTVTVDLPASVAPCYWDTWRPCRDYGWGLSVPFGNDSNVTVPRDKAVVMVTNQYTEERATYVYDGTIQRWLRIDTLTLNNEAPLSARNPEGLAALLAMRVADEFGENTLSQLTVMAANKYKLAIVSNYGVGDDCGAVFY